MRVSARRWVLGVSAALLLVGTLGTIGAAPAHAAPAGDGRLGHGRGRNLERAGFSRYVHGQLGAHILYAG